MKFSLFLISLVWSLPSFAGPSFDCTKAHGEVEMVICESQALSGLDSKIAQAYRESLRTSPNAQEVKAEQREWLKEVRNACEDVMCLEFVMGERLAELSSQPIADEPAPNHENSYKSPALAAEPSQSVESLTAKQAAVSVLPKQVDSAPGATVRNIPVDQAKPFFSEVVIFWTVVCLGGVMFVTAIGVKKYANYFHDWIDFSISTALTLVIIAYVPNIFVALAVVLLFHVIAGSAINGFSLKKGLVSSMGRCSGIFMLLSVMLASIIFIFTKMKSSTIRSRIDDGEDPMAALESDRKANHSQLFGYAVGAGATGGVLYWIDTHFIDNAAKP